MTEVDYAYEDGEEIDWFAGVSVLCDPSLPLFVVRVEPGKLHLSEETWGAIMDHAHAHDQYCSDLESKFEDWLNGPSVRYLVQDGGSYAEAERRERERRVRESAVPDRLDQFEADLEALVRQLAELQRRPTASQSETFAVRMGDARARMAVIEEQVARIRGLLDFSLVAYADAFDLQGAG